MKKDNFLKYILIVVVTFWISLFMYQLYKDLHNTINNKTITLYITNNNGIVVDSVKIDTNLNVIKKP